MLYSLGQLGGLVLGYSSRWSFFLMHILVLFYLDCLKDQLSHSSIMFKLVYKPHSNVSRHDLLKNYILLEVFASTLGLIWLISVVDWMRGNAELLR